MIIEYQSTLNCPYIKQECNGEGSSFECMVYLATNNKNDKKCKKISIFDRSARPQEFRNRQK